MDQDMSMERVIDVRVYDRKTGEFLYTEMFQWSAWSKRWEMMPTFRVYSDEMEERCGNEDFEVEV
jgi:hypothetical protein